MEGSICATPVATLHYRGASDLGRKRAHEQVRTLLSVFEVAPVERHRHPQWSRLREGHRCWWSSALIYGCRIRVP